MKKLFVLPLIILLIIGLILLLNYNQSTKILYSWQIKDITSPKFTKVLTKLHINNLYQEFNTTYLTGKDNTFIKNMTKKNIKVYALAGDLSWGSNPKEIKKELTKIITYNKNNKYKITGVVLDIESYRAKTTFNFKDYTANLTKAYNYAHKHNLEVILVIPYWYDTISLTTLKELIKNASDGISVMNYNINKTTSNIKNEIKICQKYHKSINTIYEINMTDSKYFTSYEAITKDYQNIKTNTNYQALGIAYHDYNNIIKNSNLLN